MSAPQEPVCPAAGAVAGLAREVEALGRAVDRALGLATRVDELAGVVAQLAERAAAPAGSAAASGGPPSWLDLPRNVREAHGLLAELVEWVERVYLRYADAAAHLPDCWLWHPDAVEELVWLMHAWLAAYRDDQASVKAVGDWHDRYRPGVVRRINALHGRCSLENHQQRDAGPRPGAPAAGTADVVDAIADWWAARRHLAGPTPTADQMDAAQPRPRAGGRR